MNDLITKLEITWIENLKRYNKRVHTGVWVDFSPSYIV